MARKFQIGDTVEVVKDMDGTLGSGFKVGHRGEVTEYDIAYKPYCYSVKRKNENWLSFNARELKLIRKGTK